MEKFEEVVEEAIVGTDGCTRSVFAYLCGYFHDCVFTAEQLSYVMSKTFEHDFEHEDRLIKNTLDSCYKSWGVR